MKTTPPMAWVQAHPVEVGIVVLALLVAALVARKMSKSPRLDEPLSNIAMMIGLGWSSEAVWELTGPQGANLPTGLRIAIFTVLEVILLVSMLRTKRAVDELSRAGRAGRTVWIVASVMALVGMMAADRFAEGALRAAVPLLLTLMWWQGVVPEGAQRVDGAVTWRWTPRRLALALGAIEPGERDVEQVNRERLTQHLTKLEFRRRAASGKQAKRLAARLSRLSLMADDEMIAEVRQRVARASWFTVVPLTQLDAVGDAASGTPVTQVMKPPTRRIKGVPTQAVTRADAGDAGDADPVTRAVQLVLTQGLSNRAAAAECGTSEATVRRRVKELTQPDATQPTQPTQRINGHKVLEEAS